MAISQTTSKEEKSHSSESRPKILCRSTYTYLNSSTLLTQDIYQTNELLNSLLTWILHDQVLLLLVIINQTKEDTGAAPELAVKRKHAKYS